MRFAWIVVSLGPMSAAFAACSSTVVTEGTGGAPSTTSSSTTSSSSSSTTSSTTSSSSSTTSSSSSSTTSSTSSSSSSSGAQCSGACTHHADCQAACPDPGAGSTACCGLYGCYTAPSCPPPCEPGAACGPGDFCFGNAFDPKNCVVQCKCDDSGHYACTMYSDLPSCPAVHPECGSPCDPSTPLYCACTAEGGTARCKCDPATSTWSCPEAGLCGLFDGPPKATCTDFPAGTPCGDTCECVAGCGTQIWTCFI